MTNSGSTFGIGLLLGTVLGLSLGFLFAPRPGVEIRELLSKKVEAVKAGTEDIVERATKSKREETQE